MSNPTPAEPARTGRLVRLARRAVLAMAAALCAVAPVQAPAADAPRILRYAFRIAETGFDPAYVTDLYSRTIISGIFDAPDPVATARAYLSTFQNDGNA